MRYLIYLPEPPLPATAGGRIANLHLCDGLTALGHDVNVVAVDPHGRAAADPWPVQRLVIPGEGWPARLLGWARLAAARSHRPFAVERMPSVGRELRAAVDRIRPDVVVFHHAYGWWPTELPNVLVEHNVETDRLRACGSAGRFVRAAAALERRALEGAGRVAVFSEVDRQRAERLSPGCGATVVPLGVAPAGPPRAGQADGLASVAFIGSFDYPPNREAAGSLAALAPRLLRRGVERIVLAGRAARDLPARVRGAPGIEVHSDVADMAALFRSQDLLIVPLTSGGGVRVKILEAWALGVPVVATRLGIEGLGATHGVDALIGEDPDDLVELVGRASDPAVRSAIAQGGRTRWSLNHTPLAFAAGIDRLAAQAVAGVGR